MKLNESPFATISQNRNLIKTKKTCKRVLSFFRGLLWSWTLIVLHSLFFKVAHVYSLIHYHLFLNHLTFCHNLLYCELLSLLSCCLRMFLTHWFQNSKSWWIPKPMTSISSGLQIFRCQVQVVTRMLFVVLMILSITYLLLQRSTTSKQAMPVTFILLLLGVACGFAGKFCITWYIRRQRVSLALLLGDSVLVAFLL